LQDLVGFTGGCLLYIQVFVYLQLLDFLTTIVGFKLGLGELSPFIRMLMSMGPEMGVALSKGVAILIGGVCIWTKRQHVLRWINYWYAFLVVWNLTLIIHASTQAV
jgi:hypothetical protein